MVVVSDYDQATTLWGRVPATDSPDDDYVSVFNPLGFTALDEAHILIEVRQRPLDAKSAVESASTSFVSLDDDPGQVLTTHCRPSQQPGGDFRVTAFVYDEATLAQWADTGFTPGFMQGVVAEVTPPLTEAVFDPWFYALDSDGSPVQGTFRVRRGDGAIGLVALARASALVLIEDTTEVLAASCDAGPWWTPVEGKHPCCVWQLTFCKAMQSIPFLGLIICPNCTTCYKQCVCCIGENPCHSCGWCGGTWVANFFGIGN